MSKGVPLTTFESNDDHRSQACPPIVALRAAHVDSTGTQPARLTVHVSLANAVHGVVGTVALTEGRFAGLAALEQLQSRLVGIRPDKTSITGIDEQLSHIVADCGLATSGSRTPEWAAAAAAIRTALVGVLAYADDQRQGDVYAGGSAPWFGGTWHVADLKEFYDSCVPWLKHYSCLPAPQADQSEGRINAYHPDAELITRIPGDATFAYLLKREALRRGLSSVRFPNRTFIVSDGRRKLGFTWGRAPVPNGVPPQPSLAGDDARKRLADAGVPLAVDPNRSCTHRLAIANGRVVSAIAFTPVVVTGTGEHTILDLIQHWNRIRSQNPDLRTQLIHVTDSLRAQLADNGHTLATVLEKAEQIEIPGYTNTTNIADQLHSTIEHAAVSALEALQGVDHCGVSLQLEDHRKSIVDQQATITGLDSNAALACVQYPLWGEPVDVAAMLFGACAATSGLRAKTRAKDRLTLRLSIRGKVHNRSYRSWFSRQAGRLGVTGRLTRSGDGTVVARVQGPAAAVSALVHLAATGPRGSKPTSVSTAHTWPRWYQDFRIVDRRSAVLIRVAKRVLRVVRRWVS